MTEFICFNRYDLTGAYDVSFYFAGGFIIVSGALLTILPILGKYRKYQQRKEEIQNVESGEVRIIVVSFLFEIKKPLNLLLLQKNANGVCV